MATDRISWSRKLVQGALFGFAFFSPWSIAGAQTCLGFGLIAWIAGLVFIPRDRHLIASSLGLPIAVYLGLGLFSVLLSSDLQVGLQSFRAEWIVLLFFMVINNVDSEQTARRILDVLVLVTVLIGLYAFWQHWYGWDLYRSRPLDPAGGVYEVVGLFGNHLTYGGYVMVILLLSGSLFLWGTAGRRRLFYGATSFLLMLAFLFSYARSAWVGLVGGILAIGLLLGRKVLLIGLACLLILGAAAYLWQPAAVSIQVRDVAERLQDPMTRSPRIQMWLASLRLIRYHPLLGMGWGQVSKALPVYGYDTEFGHVHNDILNVAANAGLLALAAFLWIWVRFLRLAATCRSCQQRSRWAQALATAGWGLMIAFLVAGLFQCYYTDAEDGMILWFLLGMVVAVCRANGEPVVRTEKD